MADLRQQVHELESQLQGSRRLATVGMLTGMIAHEFNNILQPMSGFAQLASRYDDESLRSKAVETAIKGSTRATAICRVLLDLASGKHQAMRKVALQTLLDDTLSAMGRDLGKDHIVMVRAIPAQMTLHTRPIELQQVLLNLLLNARQAVLGKSPAQRRIKISAQRSGNSMLIRVADSGSGIARENLRRVFEPFFTTRPEGSGLGLSFSRQIVEKLGGKLTVRSQAGKGTCFSILLPQKNK